MTSCERVCTVLALVLIAAGMVFGLVPRNWIELVLGIDPDGGSGSLESLFISIPVAIAVGIAFIAFRKYRSVTLNQ